MDMQRIILDVRGLSREFANGKVKAVDNIDIAVGRGEIVSILGPSGCGKTTTMRMIAGLDQPTSGTINLCGNDVTDLPPYRRNIGLVFQSFAIFPHMTVQQNVAFGLKMQRVALDEIESRVSAALDLVQLPLSKFGDRRSDELSGGQLQRVALARTLVTEPALVLFDEPMAALDRRLRDHMAVELRAIQKQLGIAAIYVTHDQETATTMSDRVVIMNSGRILQDGTPEDIYLKPADRFVCEFLGEVNILGIRDIIQTDGDRQLVRTDNNIDLWATGRRTHAKPGMLVAFRPEQALLHANDPGHGIEAKIESVQFRNGLHRWKVDISGASVIVHSTTVDRRIAQGERAWLTIDADKSRIVAP